MDNTTLQTNGTEERQATRVNLFDANERPIDFSKIGEKSSGKKSPFDKSRLDEVSKWLAQHGPALAKLLLIIGSGSGTIYNAIKAGHMPGVEVGALVTLILSAAGLIVECGFAYGWSRRGSYDLAGAQRATVDKIFNRSSYVMIGDLSLSVAEIAFGVGSIATYWIGIVQPIMAVHVVRLFYKLKGEHPEYIAEMEIVDLRANMKAAEIRDAANEQRLQLAEREHERMLQWAALDARHESGKTLVQSGWFKRQIRRATRESVDRQLLPDVRGKLSRLPKLLRIGKSRQN